MATARVERKLSVVLSADVQGYSRLMGADDEGTLALLNDSRQIFSTQITEYHGRIVNAPGDSILAEFDSILDAVRCAITIQNNLMTRNADLPADRQMAFRIGINLGDVIVQGSEIYGDGVNIAARLESLSEANGISVGGSIYDNLSGRPEFRFAFMGEKSVKNIAKPIRAYQVLLDSDEDTRPSPEQQSRPGIGPATHSRPNPIRPTKKSIAVLPFNNMSQDPDQDYFCDGICEDIITDLARIQGLSVIARNTMFTFKDKAVNIPALGRELGVDYVLEGSVRRSGNRARITAQLIDARSGDHVWANRYDREMSNIFDVQDELNRSIVTAIDVQLLEGEQARFWRKSAWNPEAYDLFLKARDIWRHQMNREGCLRARALYEEALLLDENFAHAYYGLATMHQFQAVNGWCPDPDRAMEDSFRLATRAIELDELSADAHVALSRYHHHVGDHDKALAEVQRAVALNPNGANVVAHLGRVQFFNGLHAEAISNISRALKLSPERIPWHPIYLGGAYLLGGQPEKALAVLRDALQASPDSIYLHIYLTAAYAALNQLDQAAAAAKEVFRVEPQFQFDRWIQRAMPFKRSEDKERIIGWLNQSGLS